MKTFLKDNLMTFFPDPNCFECPLPLANRLSGRLNGDSMYAGGSRIGQKIPGKIL